MQQTHLSLLQDTPVSNQYQPGAGFVRLAMPCRPVLIFLLVFFRRDQTLEVYQKMKITRAEVEHVSRLARLALSEGELDSLTGEMDAILDYVEQLNTLDTDGIVPTAHAVPMENAFREDKVRPGLTPEQALSNAPDAAENAFRVRRVIE
jgi:aspartyl-tRNA(Asn)/glutamyl-tRNA(Gln) amidotransferase subunit C